MNRRVFLSSVTMGASAEVASEKLRVGFAPLAGMRSTEELFWSASAECGRLGFHHLETDNTGLQIAAAYANRTGEFKQKLAGMGLSLAGLAQASDMMNAARRYETVSANLATARFLQAVGGHYITCIFDAPAMTREQRQVFAANANEVGRQIRGETDIRIGYHPEFPSVRGGLLAPIMEMTDPRYFDLFPDVGHLQAGGVDPLAVMKTYRSRIIGTHFKDWNPQQVGKADGFVPAGQGIVDFKGLTAYLRSIDFGGWIMGELDEQPEGTVVIRDYFVRELGFRL